MTEHPLQRREGKQQRKEMGKTTPAWMQKTHSGAKMGRLAVQDLEWAKARLVRLQQESSFPAPPSQGPHRSISKCKTSKL